MKVTALISRDLIDEIREVTGGKNITESIIIALKSYLAQQKLKKLVNDVKKNSFEFQEGFTAYGIRKLNRKD